MRISELICLGPKQKYFRKRGWTGHFGKHEVICPSGKIRLMRSTNYAERANGCHTPPPGLAFGEPDDRLQRGIQYAAAFRFHRCRFGLLNRPLSRAMTA